MPIEVTNDPSFSDRASITQIDDIFLLDVKYGFNASSPELNTLKIYFDKNGGTISAQQMSTGTSGNFEYDNYENFPSNYFNINIVSLDETNKKIKLNFTGKLYLNKLNLNSEAIDMSGDLTIDYSIGENANYGITLNGIEQYCSAKFNNNPWKARSENYDSQFTAPDAYKIETHFASNALPGSYNFTPSSTDNYIRFSKFNAVTLTYDYYNVTGVIEHSYREFHGLTQYSFIGTFNFTAVNPNDSTDVIQVTDGSFRSYQQY